MRLVTEVERDVDEAFADFYRREQPGAIRLATGPTFPTTK
jgi:hypothetical protein